MAAGTVKREPMIRFSPSRFPRAALLLAGSLLAGCAQQAQPVYYWGSSQQQVYGHLSSKASPDEQREKLEAKFANVNASIDELRAVVGGDTVESTTSTEE